ncbi:hypothetical protein CEXT_270421 [Caerostris extrusa]|uniref:Uncharacterized protein n=1 Tax=Caerostris extrusa TaxID=172846 RepID=A0AAV4XNR5_CAEEX|nr:hypothetical protein CEXT_270421 [Caerostris extrusa]
MTRDSRAVRNSLLLCPLRSLHHGNWPQKMLFGAKNALNEWKCRLKNAQIWRWAVIADDSFIVNGWRCNPFKGYGWL